MTKSKTYYPKVDALKGFTIFLVVFGHSIIAYPVNLHENAVCFWLFKFIYSFHMPFFFCLSGFLFSYRGNYRAYVRKKALRIAVPYLIFNLLDILPRAMFGFLFHHSRSVTESLIKIVFYGGEFWFLYTLFFIYLMFPFLAKLQRKDKKWKVIITVILFLCASIPIPSGNSFLTLLTLNRILFQFFFFNVGFLLKDAYPAIKERVQRTSPVKIRLLSVIFLSLWLVLFSTTPPQWHKSSIAVLLALLGSLTSYTLTAYKPFCDAFTRFGPWSLQLYLLNSWTMGASRYFICILMGVTNPAVIILFNVAVDFGLSYLIIKYFLARFKVARFAMGIVSPASP